MSDVILIMTIAEPNSHIQNSGIQDQRSKPRENQLHDLHQNLTESNNAGPLPCKKQKMRPPWQAVFDKRRKTHPRSSQLVARSHLVPSNYRDHFYGTLWLEEEEHIRKLEGKYVVLQWYEIMLIHFNTGVMV